MESVDDEIGPNEPFIIESITAFVAVDEHGAEGIVAFLRDDMWTPLICSSSPRMLRQMRAMAQITANAAHHPVREVNFTSRVEVDIIQPTDANMEAGKVACLAEWALLDPNEEDVQRASTHKCYLPQDHESHHVCVCGASPDDGAPVCEGCGAIAVWKGNHWETAHELSCSWMDGREIVRT